MDLSFLVFFLLLSLSQHNFAYGQTVTAPTPAPDSDNCCEEYCYSTDEKKEQSLHYSTKTAYAYIRLKGPDQTNAFNVVSQDCAPTKIWILSRHGTRLPDSTFIDQMNQLTGIRNEVQRNYINRSTVPSKGRLCQPDLINIKAWSVNASITREKANELTVQGFDDLKSLAKYYQQIFPTLLNQSYTPQKFKFYTSKAKRTADSLKAFGIGLFGPEILNSKNFIGQPLNDSFLRPEEICDLYKQQNYDDKNNPESEMNKFTKSDIFSKTVHEISRRLGFNHDLPDKHVQLIWDMCRYEQAWHVDRLSPWCAAITPTQNKVLEYKQDLKYYYKSGHGHELNSRLACFTTQSLLENLKSADQPQVIAHFAHSSLIQLFLVALGVYKDAEHLRADNFEQMENRLWKTSSISPFAANIVAIKYDCPPDSDNDPQILFLHNEKPLDIEGCKSGLCAWSYLETKYEEFINNNCQDYYCTSNSDSIRISNLLTIISFIIYVMYLILN